MNNMSAVPTTTAKAELSKYTSSDVTDIARAMQRDLQDRVLQGQHLQERLGQFKFRDEHGYYWAVEPHSLAWYRYHQGGWAQANAPQGTLEGLAHQALTPVPLRETPGEAEGAHTGGDPIEGLATSVQQVSLAYELGQITSAAAEGLTALFYLVDKEIRLWTVGFHSGAWYYFNEGRWIKADLPLEASALSEQTYGPRACPSCSKPADGEGEFCRYCGTRLPVRSEEAFEQAKAKLMELVKSGVLIPEPVTAPFSPPPGFPGQVTGVPPLASPSQAMCSNCGRAAAPGTKFCIYCGQALGGAARNA